MGGKLIISGVGCSLVDRLYNDVSFSAESFIPYLSKEKGDGGLTPGQLVFKEEFEKFAGSDFQSALKGILSERNYLYFIIIENFGFHQIIKNIFLVQN